MVTCAQQCVACTTGARVTRLARSSTLQLTVAATQFSACLRLPSTHGGCACTLPKHACMACMLRTHAPEQPGAATVCVAQCSSWICCSYRFSHSICSNLMEDTRCSLVVQMPGWTGLANARVTIFGDASPIPEELQEEASKVFSAKVGITMRMFQFACLDREQGTYCLHCLTPIPCSTQPGSNPMVRTHLKICCFNVQDSGSSNYRSSNFVYFRMNRITDIYFVGGFGTVQWLTPEEYLSSAPDAIVISGNPTKMLQVGGWDCARLLVARGEDKIRALVTRSCGMLLQMQRGRGRDRIFKWLERVDPERLRGLTGGQVYACVAAICLGGSAGVSQHALSTQEQHQKIVQTWLNKNL